MSEKAAQQRIDTALKEEDTLDRMLAAQNQKIRETIGNYKFWLAIELRKAHQEIFRLTEEKDLLIKENLKMRNQLFRIKDFFKGDIR
jgi:hypothetical protein